MKLVFCFLLICALGATGVEAGDWPTWRYDAARSGHKAEGLSETLHLHWVRVLPAPKPTWPMEKTVLEHPDYTYEFSDDEDKLQFDVSYNPVAAAGRLFVPSMMDDAVIALDLDTGRELWRFEVDGPVRFSPVVSKGRVYFTSDDGYVYCIDAAQGTLVWRFRGGPAERFILGNERLINSWPARGAPVIAEDTLYFAAGIWPFMGIFIHALNAETGQVIWTNSASGSMYDLHQHGGAFSFGGVAPQGHLAVSGDKLLVSGGLTVPAVYDRHTGEFLYYRQSSTVVGKGAGGHAVFARGDWFFNHGTMYSLEDGAQFGPCPASVLTGDAIVGLEKGEMIAHASKLDVQQVEIKDRLQRQAIREVYSMKPLWRVGIPEELDRLFFKAGNLYYAGGSDGSVAALRVHPGKAAAEVVWRDRIDSAVWTMLAAQGRLLVVSESGRIYCYGADQVKAREWAAPKAALPPASRQPQVIQAMADVQVREGYAFVWGLGDGQVLHALLETTDFHMIAIDPDVEKVARERRVLARAGLYGTRASVLPGAPTAMALPPYLASVIAVGDAEAAGLSRGRVFVERLFFSLRPYGGTAYLALSEAMHRRFAGWVDQAGLPRARVYRVGPWTALKREGALPGAGQWTHEHATAANTVKSDDDLVKAPLGVLWFGGPTNENVLPRHGYGPVPQVCGGRLFILGVHAMGARDVYTGRELWQVLLPGIGERYQTLPEKPGKYLPHQPGAAFVGSPYVSALDGVYVAYRDSILHLDPASGKRLAAFVLRGKGLALDGDPLADFAWSYIGLWNDLLIVGAGPQIFDDVPIGGVGSYNATSSQYLVAMDRYSGDILWHKRAERGFRHNAIAVESGTVFAIDGLTETALDLMRRRGVTPQGEPVLYAFDARTGRVKWRRGEGVFGTWLGFSAAHDILIQAGRGQRGNHGLPDEPRDRIKAHRGADGLMLWEHEGGYQGPLALHIDRIIPSAPSRGTSAGALDLFTGKPIANKHPITGSDIAWQFNRTYGCGTGLTSTHLLTFRSGAAGFYDLKGDGGTGNFGGFRAGCTNNLVVADGVLSAPDYTRTCQCAYQNRTSLAMVPMPEVELWTYSAIPASSEPVMRVGLNFGAPGDRKAETGTLWLDYPSVGGTSPDIPVSLFTEDVAWYRKHSSLMTPGGDGPAWIGASGLIGETDISVTVASGEDAKNHTYTVTLYFAEPEASNSARRSFDVYLQDQKVLRAFDPVKEAGAVRKTVGRSFSGILASEAIRIKLKKSTGGGLPPVLSGVEIIREP